MYLAMLTPDEHVVILRMTLLSFVGLDCPGEGLAEVTIRDEGRDMWQVYLERGLFSAAFRAARTQAQRNAVNVAEAEAALVAGDTIRAARLYGKASLCAQSPCHAPPDAVKDLGNRSHIMHLKLG